ncbi:pilus assembly PilX family protein [Massilia sp. DD77]|uniref:pilus assembly PilX family protein n=1 Tax=Massilia sp. DD77 TaxID=3109349 RepID=UPI002FFD9EEE
MMFPRRESGITLVTALVMLVLLTLIALTTFNVGKSNLQIVSNMQQRDEAAAAAREVIEEAISTTRFSETPDHVLASPCGGPNQRCVDTNGDGTDDVRVRIAPRPSCVKAPVIKNTALDLAKVEDQVCSMGSAQSFGVAGAVDGNSACADSVWEISAAAADVETEAQVQVTQGVAVRVARDDVTNNCPTT